MCSAVLRHAQPHYSGSIAIICVLSMLCEGIVNYEQVTTRWWIKDVWRLRHFTTGRPCVPYGWDV